MLQKIATKWRIPIAMFIILSAVLVMSSSHVAAFDEASNVFLTEAEAQQQLRGESELPWLFAVYIVTWGAFFGYVFIVSRRQREMQREINALKRALAANESREDEG